MSTFSTQSSIHGSISPRKRSAARPVAAVVLAACIGLLGLSAWLKPDPAGLGTHEQLGLPPCGFYAATGFPCATCGMTTAFAYSAHGQIVTAFITQPAGAVLAIATAAAAILCLYVLVTGRSLAPMIHEWSRPSLFFGFAGIVVASWAYKILAVRGFHW